MAWACGGEVPSPLAPGENDLFVITRQQAFDTSSNFEMDLMVGGANSMGCISCSLLFSYSGSGSPGRGRV
jgi:hypothetical protein